MDKNSFLENSGQDFDLESSRCSTEAGEESPFHTPSPNISRKHSQTKKSSSSIYDKLLKESRFSSNPEIREGLLKMQKLEKILASKARKERKVKSETKQLVEKLRQDLASLASHGREESYEEKENYCNFTAVASYISMECLPVSTNKQSLNASDLGKYITKYDSIYVIKLIC